LIWPTLVQASNHVTVLGDHGQGRILVQSPAIKVKFNSVPPILAPAALILVASNCPIHPAEWGGRCGTE
jgi:hypothetical protein